MSAETKNVDQETQATDAPLVTANDKPQETSADKKEDVNKDKNSSCCGSCS